MGLESGKDDHVVFEVITHFRFQLEHFPFQLCLLAILSELNPPYIKKTFSNRQVQKVVLLILKQSNTRIH